MAFGQIALSARYAAVNVATAGTVTLVQVVAPTSGRVVVNQLAVSFNGDSNTDEPYQVQLLRQSGAGTSSALSLVKANSDDLATFQSTARSVFTAEPTAQEILFSWYVHPQVGVIWEPPLDTPIVVPANTRIGLRILAPVVQANSSTGYISFLE